MNAAVGSPRETRLALAPQGVYPSWQGEGAMVGLPMVFIRLAGCSVGCRLCDTDYRVSSHATPSEIASMAAVLADWSGPRWAWITGGEPADRDLAHLIASLKDVGFLVAVATSGHKPIPPRWISGIDWLSVSPHDPVKWVVKEGQELVAK